MNASHLLIAAAAVALVAAAAHPARAQSAEAEALFRDGRRLLAEGKLAEACQKLEASDKLESSTGTLLNLADCRERSGQLATAWATFVKAAGAAHRNGDDARQAEATRRGRALEPRLSYLTIAVPASSQVDGLVVARGGVVVEAAQWNTGVPIDPGTYTLTAQAPGRTPLTKQVTIDEAVRITVAVRWPSSVEPPSALPAPSGTLIDPWPAMPRVAPVPSPRPRASGRFTAMRWVAVGAGVLGLAAIGGGVERGLASRDLWAAADARCPETICNDTEGLRRSDAAGRAAVEANVLYGTGGAVLAGAVVLWFLGRPRRDEAAPTVTAQIGADRVGVALSGSF